MRGNVGRRALSEHLSFGLAKGERLGLREDIAHQDVVVFADRVERLAKANQVDGDHRGSLVDQLVEGVLAVRARLAPIDHARVVVDVLAIEHDVLAVRLHCQLLEVRGEALEVLLVRHDPDGLDVEEVAVPDGEEAH